MKTSKKFLSIIISVIMLSSLTACDSKGGMFGVVFGDGSDEVIGTMTVSEFDLKIDRLLASVFNDSETHLSNSKYVVNGKMDAKEEHALVEKTIEDVESVIEEVNKLAEPSSKTNEKTDVLLRLTEYKNALTNYALALEGGNNDDISSAADVIMTSMESLKGTWQTYTE